MNSTNSKIHKIVFSGVIAALYAALTIAVAPLSYGIVQLRFSEALCILPFFFPFTVWGLFVGCIVANLFSTVHIVDVGVGSIASLLAAFCTMWIGRQLNRERFLTKAFACFPPVIINAIIIGAMIAYVTFGTSEQEGFLVAAGMVGAGQFIVMYVLGLPLMLFLSISPVLNKLNNLYGGKSL